ncbi:MAG: protocatechuate 3,4-dioxygenase [Pseudomonadota bacterium]
MSAKGLSRRGLIAGGLGAGACAQAAASQLIATPRQTEGPFYPIAPQTDKDADLTQIGDSDRVARGEVIQVAGRVLDQGGAPIPGAVVDVWQANAAGRYSHEADPNPAPLDPDFQGWAILTADAEGAYRFKTIKPGAYPVSEGWSRPPHIHFKVSRRGYREVTTQMYFDGEPLNEVDRILNAHSAEERRVLVAKRASGAEPFLFDVVLAAV